jgi:hypothetical protein
MSHSGGLNVTHAALAYVEQQREATATDALAGPCHPKKRMAGCSEISITYFLKK